MINFLHTFLPQPIIFQLGPIVLHWYGLLVVAGIIAGLIVLVQLAKQVKINSDEVYSLVFYLIIFSLISARLYACALNYKFYLSWPIEILAVWHGGLAIHGGIIGGLITLFVYCRYKKQSFMLWADMLGVALPLGQAIGRFGNYFNQELFGWPTNLPWGIPIDLSNRPLGYLSVQYFQPTFLYEAILNLINFLLLFLLFKKTSRSGHKPGLILFLYLINYSLIRIFLEFFRLDSVPSIFGWRLPVVVSLLIIIASLLAVLIRQWLTSRSQNSI